jgi:polynucleotide 5'-hydroxyl-kinase GRC3/NOL9
MFIHGGKTLNRTVEKGKTLVVDGPASVTIQSGKAEVFGFQIADSRKIVIREGKRLPFSVQETASFVLAIGAEASIEEKEGSTIPQSWVAAYDELSEVQKKPFVVLVVGGVDSGKSSFCTYIVNRLVNGRRRIAVLDEDLGQSDLGPPCTVAYVYVSKPVTDLFNLKPTNAFFVGANSPSGTVDRTIEGIAFLKEEILADARADFVIVNTDGWAGEEAVQFKGRLASVLGPDVVFCLQSEEAPPFCAAMGDAFAEFRQVRVESPVAVRERNREKRRSLRELGYSKYLDGARVKVFSLNHLKIEGKESHALIEGGKAQNLLVGLHDLQRRFLGIGVLREVDYTRRAIKVFTAVSEKPASVFFGSVRLDDDLREVQEKANA